MAASPWVNRNTDRSVETVLPKFTGIGIAGRPTNAALCLELNPRVDAGKQHEYGEALESVEMCFSESMIFPKFRF